MKRSRFTEDQIIGILKEHVAPSRPHQGDLRLDCQALRESRPVRPHCSNTGTPSTASVMRSSWGWRAKPQPLSHRQQPSSDSASRRRRGDRGGTTPCRW